MSEANLKADIRASIWLPGLPTFSVLLIVAVALTAARLIWDASAMATLVHDCPHCRASLMSFVIFGAHSWPVGQIHSISSPQVNVVGECQKCRRPITAVLKWRASIDGTTWAQNCQKLTKDAFSVPGGMWNLVEAWPQPLPAEAPEYLPAPVAKAFMQGETNLALDGHEEPAATMFRRSLDLALKVQFPELKGTLDKKISKLAETHVIPQSLADWAHEVRGIGNDGAHDLEGCTIEDAQAARDFVDAVLRYLVTLPKMIELRRPVPEPEPPTVDQENPTA